MDRRSPAASRPCQAAWSAGSPYRCRSARPTPRDRIRCGTCRSASANAVTAPGSGTYDDGYDPEDFRPRDFASYIAGEDDFDPLSLVACAALVSYVLRQDLELKWVRRWPGVVVTSVLTLALAIGAGSQMLQPLAIAVIGGILASMVLSLVITPAVHYFLAD